MIIMIQLVQPDLSVVGRVSYCLEYARKVFGAPAVEPTAWAGWEATQFKHEDNNYPTDVAVPLWFRFPANGTTPGHVAINVPGKGIYSSPYKTGTTHAVLSSLAEIEEIYKVNYEGWSEDISKVRVVEGGNDVSVIGDTEARIIAKWIYGYTNELDIEGAVNGLVGTESNTALRRADASPTAAAYQQYIDDLKKSGSTPANIKPYDGPQLYLKD